MLVSSSFGIENGYGVWCPGCETLHAIGNQHSFNGNFQSPTFNPSILSLHGKSRCHSFIKDGFWEFLSDCDHELAGQMVPMVPVPVDAH